MGYLTLQQWIETPSTNAWVTYSIASGSVSVYVKKNVFNRKILEIASISTISGFGASWSLYRKFTENIPTIAENVLNPDLDRMLEKLGWFAYYDLAETPTRVNKKFQELYPDYVYQPSANLAVHRSIVKGK